jgi:methionine-rich copper-binding protein CopC
MSKFAATTAGIAITAVMAFVVAPASTLAHARHKSSTPAVGEVLSTPPSAVTITFTQDIQKVSGTYDIQVTLDRGESVTAGPAAIAEGDRSTMSVPLKPLTTGRYEVHWKNVSDEDGDPIEGAFSFYLNKQPNSIDRLADTRLAAIGAPEATGTAGTGSPAAAMTTATATIAVTTTATAASSNGSGSGSSNTTLIVIIAVIATVAMGGGGAVVAYLRIRSG